MPVSMRSFFTVELIRNSLRNISSMLFSIASAILMIFMTEQVIEMEIQRLPVQENNILTINININRRRHARSRLKAFNNE